MNDWQAVTAATEPPLSRKLHALGRRLGTPISGTFELTAGCNFNCRMCYIHDRNAVPRANGELTAEQWLQIGQQAAEAGTVFVLLTGGEPLLRGDFAEIYTGLKRLGLMVSVNTGGALMNDLAIAGGCALAKALRLLNRNALPPEVPQDDAAATFVKKLKKTDGLIDWDRPVIVTERKIRAYNPWPGSYTFLPERFRRKGNTGRLVVLRSKIVRLEPGWEAYAPGTVLKVGKEGPVVRCHDTALLLSEVKPEGAAAMDGGAFVRGRPLRPFEDVLLDA